MVYYKLSLIDSNGKQTEIKDFLPGTERYDLKAICDFTMKYENEERLREHLLSRGLIKEKDSDKEIVITYYYQRAKELKVPYKEDERFFVMAKLIDTIAKEVSKNPAFMEYFHTRENMPSIFFELRFNTGQFDTYNKVARFIDIMCYNEGKFRFKAFYDIAIVVADVYRRRKAASAPKPEPVRSSSTLSYEQEFQLQELLARQNKRAGNEDDEAENQLSLF